MENSVKKTRKTVLLTGATGAMGTQVVKTFRDNSDMFDVVLMILAADKNRHLFKDEPGQTIVIGDLTVPEDVRNVVKGCDYILHMGGLVSPEADDRPKLTWDVNVGGTKNVVDAVLEMEEELQPKIIYIGSVAQTGNRSVPVHWGRIGDPLIPALLDPYSQSKLAAERYLIESGVKHWVSLRQTAMVHYGIVQRDNGIIYHQPLNNHLEWVTANDTARLLRNICMDEMPSKFWNHVYNVGGGANFRKSFYEFLEMVFGLMNIHVEDIYEPNMFALRNFHGHYYLDSDKLEELVPFRKDTLESFLKEMKAHLPMWVKAVKYLPKPLVKFYMRQRALHNPVAPLYWFKHNVEKKINVFFGSRKVWEQIGGWNDFVHQSDPPHKVLDHGFDETKQLEELSIEELQRAADFRGGEYLSNEAISNETEKKVWKCSQGHVFEASPFLILRAGHWCEECAKDQDSYDEQAARSPFMAQVWREDRIEKLFRN